MYFNLNKPILRPTNPRGSSQPLPLKDCCKIQENMTVIWTRDDLRLSICKECGHKYWRLFADRGSLGSNLRGAK